jgi:hypothetical protein
MLVRTGDGFWTENAFVSDALPPAVVTVTVRAPIAADEETVMFATTCVALLYVTELTVMPVPPKLTVVPPLMKFEPLRVMLVVWPVAPAVGEMLASVGAGVAAPVTVNPLVSVAVPPPVVTEASRTPAVAPEAMVMFAVTWVAELNVTLLTVIPLPLKVTDVPPLT